MGGRNADGETVDKWTSDGTNHIVSKLGAGEYCLKKRCRPGHGYVIAMDIKFTVDAGNNVTVENVDSTAVSDNGYPLIRYGG